MSKQTSKKSRSPKKISKSKSHKGRKSRKSRRSKKHVPHAARVSIDMIKDKESLIRNAGLKNERMDARQLKRREKHSRHVQTRLSVRNRKIKQRKQQDIARQRTELQNIKRLQLEVADRNQRALDGKVAILEQKDKRIQQHILKLKEKHIRLKRKKSREKAKEKKERSKKRKSNMRKSKVKKSRGWFWWL